MKKLIIALAVMAAATTAQAEPMKNEQGQPMTAEQTQTVCKFYSVVAETVMHSRQTGTGMATTMDMVSDVAYAYYLVLDAYEQPRRHTDEEQQRAIEDYRDGVYLECYKEFLE